MKPAFPRGGVRVPCQARDRTQRAVPTLCTWLQPLHLSFLTCVVGVLLGLGRGEAGSELSRPVSEEAVPVSGGGCRPPKDVCACEDPGLYTRLTALERVFAEAL